MAPVIWLTGMFYEHWLLVIGMKVKDACMRQVAQRPRHFHGWLELDLEITSKIICKQFNLHDGHWREDGLHGLNAAIAPKNGAASCFFFPLEIASKTGARDRREPRRASARVWQDVRSLRRGAQLTWMRPSPVGAAQVKPTCCCSQTIRFAASLSSWQACFFISWF